MIRNHTFRSESLEISYLGAPISDSRHVQLAIYTVWDEESESEVKKCQILEPGGKNQEKRNWGRKKCLSRVVMFVLFFPHPPVWGC